MGREIGALGGEDGHDLASVSLTISRQATVFCCGSTPMRAGFLLNDVGDATEFSQYPLTTGEHLSNQIL